MTNAFIVASKRTPFGAFGGKLANQNAAQLGGHAAKAALAQLPANTPISSTQFGQVTHSDSSSPYLARHVGHFAGVPINTPALTVNRLCGSGFQAIIGATQEINCGDSDVILTGGTENMSMSPYTLHGVRFGGTRYGVDLKLVDSLAVSLVDQVPVPTPMGITAENLAEKYGVTREQCDEFALRSQGNWEKAKKEGAFKDEIAPLEVKVKKTTETFDTDEHPRPTTIETLGRLKPVFKKDGTVTAGNASGICDGAAANVVASEEAIKQYNLKPLARVVSYGITACEPSLMGIGPVEASRMALKRAGLTMEDMDLVDINEAFAAQVLSVQKELEIPDDKLNLFGGAIALGHPLAASGGRIISNLTYNLHRLDKKYALGGACIGGGQGIAMVLERV
ncbi:acetyl-CoA C-acyltransferase [Malassezia sp. CBS 17886]|nr:acetyl-CoA C-acyltransferase [Malassezia sp. CBS 17886]